MRHRGLGFGLIVLLSILCLHQSDRAGRSPSKITPASFTDVEPASAGNHAPSRRSAERPDPIDRLAPPISACIGKDGYRLTDSGVSVFFGRSMLAIGLIDRDRHQGWGLHWGLVGSVERDPRPESPLPGRVSSFVGAESTWASDLPTYGAMRYPDVLPGMDLRMESRPHGIEYAVHAAAGVEVGGLRWRFAGATEVEAVEGGVELRIRTAIGDLRESGLLVYQDSPSGRRVIPARYESFGTDEYTIVVGEYDRTRPLVIDPTISWSTFLGGKRRPENTTPSDTGLAIARDSSGFLYITGQTLCTDLPTIGGFDDGFSGVGDAFVAKIDPTGPSIVWSSYLGGGRNDAGFAIAVDADSNVFVTGQTTSFDFPSTGGFDTTLSGIGEDAFLTKINAGGSTLAWSTYLGDDGIDSGWGLAVDDAGDVYVVGTAGSSKFPKVAGLSGDGPGFFVKVSASGTLLSASHLPGDAFAVTVDADKNAYVTGATLTGGLATAGAYQSTLNGTTAIFVMRIAAGGGAIDWFTYLGGGNFSEAGRAIRLDGSGNVYVAGQTHGSNFPSAVVFGTPPLSNDIAFVAKLNSTATMLTWSVLLDGNSIARGIALDSSQNVVVVGETHSGTFPTLGGFQNAHGASMADAFVTKIAADGASLVWSSYLGGNGEDLAYGVVLDGNNNVYVVGETRSNDFPTNGGFDKVLGPPGTNYPDAFVTKVKASGAAIGWSTYFGGHQGPANDRGKNIAVDADGNVYVTGYTIALDFPVLGAFNASNNGYDDVFVSKFGPTGTLTWSTYIGGSGEEMGLAIAVDVDQAVYVAGNTYSSDFPKVNAFYSPATNTPDGFVLKLKPSGSGLSWSSRLGGSQQDVTQALALDGAGHIVVAGWTTSDDLPGKALGFNAVFGGGQDGFVAVIDDSGPSLLWTSYLGGSSTDVINGLAIDPLGNIVVSGQTFSSDFPTVNPFQPAPGGGADGFVAKISTSPPFVIWASYLGGSAEDVAYGLAVDPSGNAYVTGATLSTNFPVPNGIDPSHNGFYDGFVAKIDATGSAITWSTYLGGTNWDFGAGISVSETGAVVVSGNTYSTDFPTVPSATLSGSNDAYIAVFSNDGSTLLSTTYLGGRGHDEAYGIVVKNGSIYVTGFTTSEDFPTIGGFDPTLGFEEDAFVVKLDGVPDGGVASFPPPPANPPPPAGPPPPPPGPPKKKNDGGAAGCGLLGVDAMILASLLLVMRRWEKR